MEAERARTTRPDSSERYLCWCGAREPVFAICCRGSTGGAQGWGQGVCHRRCRNPAVGEGTSLPNG